MASWHRDGEGREEKKPVRKVGCRTHAFGWTREARVMDAVQGSGCQLLLAGVQGREQRVECSKGFDTR